MEINGRNRRYRIHAQALCMSCQLTAVLRIVAGHMGDNGHLSLYGFHHSFQNCLAFLLALVNTFAGGTAHIDALYSFFQQMLCQGFGPLCADASILLVAGIKCRNNPLILCNISHNAPPFFPTGYLQYNTLIIFFNKNIMVKIFSLVIVFKPFQ